MAFSGFFSWMAPWLIRDCRKSFWQKSAGKKERPSTETKFSGALLSCDYRHKFNRSDSRLSILNYNSVRPICISIFSRFAIRTG